MQKLGFFSNAAWLDVAKNHGYGPLPIPVQRDDQISSLIEEWKCLDALERTEASCSVTEDQAATLLAYSERMATLAVRVRSRDVILLGLLALGIDGWRSDWRENTLVLCLHFDASKRIGTAPESTFRDAARFLSPRVAQALQEFLKRSEEDRSLEAMGYKVGMDRDGFRYQRTW